MVKTNAFRKGRNKKRPAKEKSLSLRPHQRVSGAASAQRDVVAHKSQASLRELIFFALSNEREPEHEQRVDNRLARRGVAGEDVILTRCKVEGMLISKFQFRSFLLVLALGQTAAAQAASGQEKSPHGIFDILSDTVSESQPCWTNPAIDGVRWRGGWNRVQRKVDGPYDWSGPDEA